MKEFKTDQYLDTFNILNIRLAYTVNKSRMLSEAFDRLFCATDLRWVHKILNNPKPTHERQKTNARNPTTTMLPLMIKMTFIVRPQSLDWIHGPCPSERDTEDSERPRSVRVSLQSDWLSYPSFHIIVYLCSASPYAQNDKSWRLKARLWHQEVGQSIPSIEQFIIGRWPQGVLPMSFCIPNAVAICGVEKTSR